MLRRFLRIKNEFGTYIFVRILIMLIGLLGMTLLGIFLFSSILAGIITLVGLLLGFLFKNQIPEGVEYYPKIFSVGLFIYAIILLLGDRFGIANNWKLVIITVTTVILFSLQFWSLSDPSVVNEDKIDQAKP